MEKISWIEMYRRNTGHLITTYYSCGHVVEERQVVPANLCVFRFENGDTQEFPEAVFYELGDEFMELIKDVPVVHPNRRNSSVRKFNWLCPSCKRFV